MEFQYRRHNYQRYDTEAHEASGAETSLWYIFNKSTRQYINHNSLGQLTSQSRQGVSERQGLKESGGGGK